MEKLRKTTESLFHNSCIPSPQSTPEISSNAYNTGALELIFHSKPRKWAKFQDFLHYITLHSLDPKLVKMTVGCGTSHTNTKTHIQYI
jgi:hypothetical protein